MKVKLILQQKIPINHASVSLQLQMGVVATIKAQVRILNTNFLLPFGRKLSKVNICCSSTLDISIKENVCQSV